MANLKRAFIFGAGFSKPAGVPLATDLLPLLIDKLKLPDMRVWLDEMRERLAWLSGTGRDSRSFALNIEQLFHYAYFDMEVHRLRQHLEPVGRADGPGTAWKVAQAVETWLSYLERALCDVVFEADAKAGLEPIKRWARAVRERDAILTFNYDTLAERALTEEGEAWNHGTGRDADTGIPVFKLHGSIDWIVAHRSESFSKLDLLFDKKNANRSDGGTGHVEDDCRLWRCRTAEQLKKWIEDRDLQGVPEGASPRSVGMAGLGAYKELHQIPGLGRVWAGAMRALYEADLAVVVGFSMSDFDAMAQTQFADVARVRLPEKRPLRVLVIDPSADKEAESRFRRVFRSVDFVQEHHENFDWGSVP